MNSKKQRDRGRILTSDGLSRLQQAIRAWELKHEIRCTQERIRELTSAVKEGGLDPGTIRKILKAKEGVDPESIRCLFTTFGLQLSEADLVSSSRLQIQADPSFVGREGAIGDLNTLINRGTKVIVIQARGGVGKTTLARKYLQQEFGSYLEFPIAKETKDIASIESLIEEKLRQLGEEPGREFFVSLDRFKRKLQNERIGILIDNLEPALDSAGKFIEVHRRYVELLRILTDSVVQSVTFITSRERLREASVTIEHYMLRSLDIEAWEQFFQSRNLATDTSAFAALHNAYGGNAKAMDIIRSAILEDYAGDVAAYWQANQYDLFIERDLEDLVTQQFNRLQQIDADAYNLLCRMGCYRYQDVPTVPIEGLLCLLWDVPENRQRRVVKSLQDRSLVEFEDGEYWLHPVIRAEAVIRLRISEAWETASQIIAEYWTRSVKTIETVRDALQAFEPYYHYVSINNLDQAANVILERRSSEWARDIIREDLIGTSLGGSFHRFGLLQQMISAINQVVGGINCGGSLSRLYNILGDLCRTKGELKRAIECHQKSREIAIKFHIKSVELASLLNLGFCQIYLWELSTALEYFELADSFQNEELDEYIKRTSATAWSCLAFLYSSLGNKAKTANFLRKTIDSTPSIKLGIRGTGYRLYFLGRTYRNLGNPNKAIEIYNEAFSFSKKSCFSQLSAMLLNGLAEVYRDRKDFNTSVQNLLKAVEVSKSIGAINDLVESCYQLGLTYQAMGTVEKGNESFQEAMRIFSSMEAPKQVERVRQSMLIDTDD